MSQGNSRLVEDLGQGKFRVKTLPGAPAQVFIETVDTAADLPAPSERPAGWPIFVKDANSTVVSTVDPTGTAAWLPPIGGLAATYGGARSLQLVAADLTLTPEAGKDLPDTAFLAPVMGNLHNDGALLETGNYLGGVIGEDSVTGAKGTHLAKGAVLGLVSGDPAVTDSDGCFVAILDGDAAAATPLAMFKAKKFNSNPGANPQYGLDLQEDAHDGFAELVPSKASVRLEKDVVDMVGVAVPTDGVTGATFAGPGSTYRCTGTPGIYINVNTKASPTWKAITHA